MTSKGHVSPEELAALGIVSTNKDAEGQEEAPSREEPLSFAAAAPVDNEDADAEGQEEAPSREEPLSFAAAAPVDNEDADAEGQEEAPSREEPLSFAAAAPVGNRHETSTGPGRAGEPPALTRRAAAVPVDMTASEANLPLMLDITLTLTAELGSIDMSVENILALRPGSIIGLDTFTEEPTNVMVNGRLLGHGEVIVLEEQFGIRLVDVAAASPAL